MTDEEVDGIADDLNREAAQWFNNDSILKLNRLISEHKLIRTALQNEYKLSGKCPHGIYHGVYWYGHQCSICYPLKGDK